jgi:hypothetical protein
MRFWRITGLVSGRRFPRITVYISLFGQSACTRAQVPYLNGCKEVGQFEVAATSASYRNRAR